MGGRELIARKFEGAHSGLMLAVANNDQPAGEESHSYGSERGPGSGQRLDSVVVAAKTPKELSSSVFLAILAGAVGALYLGAVAIGYLTGAAWLQREGEPRD